MFSKALYNFSLLPALYVSSVTLPSHQHLLWPDFKKFCRHSIWCIWIPHWVSICISLMNNDIASLYMRSFVMCTSLSTHLFKSFVYYYSVLIIFYGFEKCLLSCMWSANLFLHSVFCLLLLLTISFEVQLVIFSVTDYAFDILSQQYLRKTSHKGLYLYFTSEVL